MISDEHAKAIERRRAEARAVVEKPSGFLSWRGAYDADVAAVLKVAEEARRDEARHVEILLETWIAGRNTSAISTRQSDARAVTEFLELFRSVKMKKGSLT